jgi:hypothetical protein
MHILAIVCGIFQCCRNFSTNDAPLFKPHLEELLAGNMVAKSMEKIKARKRKIQIKKRGGNGIAWILEASLVVTTIGVISTHCRGLLAIILDLKSPIKGG